MRGFKQKDFRSHRRTCVRCHERFTTSKYGEVCKNCSKSKFGKMKTKESWSKNGQ